MRGQLERNRYGLLEYRGLWGRWTVPSGADQDHEALDLIRELTDAMYYRGPAPPLGRPADHQSSGKP